MQVQYKDTVILISVVDPDSMGSLDWDTIQEGKNYPEKYKTVNKLHVLKCWMFSFEG
jgi:hypothetical protein